MLIASVYSLSVAVIYFSTLPSKPYDWERQETLTHAYWLGVPAMILVVFIWSKVSKKFDL